MEFEKEKREANYIWKSFVCGLFLPYDGHGHTTLIFSPIGRVMSYIATLLMLIDQHNLRNNVQSNPML